MAVIEYAATVAVLRTGPTGLETLMLRRPAHGSFANAWVFPGGKIDEADRVPDDDPLQVAQHAGARETFEETGIRVNPATLVPFALWVPPTHLPRRFETTTLLADVDEGATAVETLRLSAGEVVEARWLSPAAALEEHRDTEFSLMPPTWVTLHWLGQHAHPRDALAAAANTGIQRFETRGDPAKGLVLWQQDEVWDGAVETPAGARHRLVTAARPWQYLRNEAP